MKQLSVMMLLFIISFYCVTAFTKNWKLFKRIYGKTFANQTEELIRFRIWRENSELIKRHNAQANKGNYTFWLKMNRYGDLVKKN